MFIPMILGEMLFAIGLTVFTLQLAMNRDGRLRSVSFAAAGAILLAVSSWANPIKRSPVYALHLRPFATACLLVVAVTLRLLLQNRPIPPVLITTSLIGGALGIGAVLLLQRLNARA